MRRAPLLLLLAALGCSSPAELTPLGTSKARLVVSMQGSESARFKVTAVNEETAEVAFDQAIDVEGSQASIVDLSIAPASYTFHVEAFADASMQTSLGSGETHAELVAGASTDIKLNAQVSDTDADGKGDSASVTVAVNVAPKIEGIEVQIAGQAGGALAAGGEVGATLHVEAVDAEGGALTYVWAGAGLDGAVQGSDTLVISAQTAAALAASSGHEHAALEAARQAIVLDPSRADAVGAADYPGTDPNRLDPALRQLCGRYPEMLRTKDVEMQAEVPALLKRVVEAERPPVAITRAGHSIAPRSRRSTPSTRPT